MVNICTKLHVLPISLGNIGITDSTQYGTGKGEGQREGRMTWGLLHTSHWGIKGILQFIHKIEY